MSNLTELQKAIARKDYDQVALICDAIKVEHGPIRVHVGPDHDAENPCDLDGWKAYSFSKRHHNFARPESLGFDEYGNVDGDIALKMDAGLAFPLSYFEHGSCMWSLKGAGPQCRWDSVDLAGILVWEQDEENIGATTFEDRRKDAASFLERYTAWCNGSVFSYSTDDFCAGGFYELDDLVSSLREEIEEDRSVVFTGEIRGEVEDAFKAARSKIEA